MTQQTHSSIVIASDPATIMDVIADVETYADWIGGIDSATADVVQDDGRPAEATFHGNFGVTKDVYSVSYDWQETEVSWHLLKSDMLKHLEGTYVCTDRGDGTTDVEYRLTMELNIPVVGMLRRRGEKVVIDSALKGLKRRVEG